MTDDRDDTFFAPLTVLDAADLRVRPLPEVTARAGRLRRTRRAGVAVLASAVVAAGAGTVWLLPPQTSAAPPSTRTTSVAPDLSRCDETASPARHPGLVHVVGADAAGPLTAAGIEEVCGEWSIPFVLATQVRTGADGTVLQAVGLARPLDDAGRDQSADGYEPVDPAVPFRGTTAALSRSPAAPGRDAGENLRLEWAEPGAGVRWTLLGSGVDRADLLAVGAALRAGPQGVDPASLGGPAAGWEALPTTPEPDRPTTTFSAYYGDGPSALRLSVAGEGVEQASQLLPLLPPGTARVTDVDGARATFVDGGRGVPSTLSWQRGGLSFYLEADAGFDDLVRWAGAVEKADPADPVVAAAPAPTD